jgi:non-ribosomal peptide synthetase component F/aryl carrier-like protein
MRGPVARPPALWPAVDAALAASANRIVFADSSRELSASDVARRVSWAAGGLVAAGVRPGDELVLVGQHRTIDQAVVQLAALRAGAVLTMRSTWPAGPADERHPRPSHVVFLEPDGEPGATISAAQVLGARQPIHTAVPGPGDNAIILETSGTTGRSRRVLLSHTALLTRITSLAGLLAPDSERVFAARMPANSVDAYREVIGSAMTGATLVFPPRRPADPADEVAWLRDAGVTALIVVPSVVQRLRPGERAQLRNVRDWILTGEAVPASLVRELRRGQRVARIYNVYGCTEAPGCGIALSEVDGAAPLVPVGRPLSGVTASIVDEHGRVVGAGTVGEICLGGPGVAAGYEDDPRSTAARFVPDPGTHGGRRFATGDLAVELPDAIHLTGRRDRRVKLHANTVDLDEVEAALVAMPGIAEAAAELPAGPLPDSIEVWVAPDGGHVDTSVLGRSLQATCGIHLVIRPVHVVGRLPRVPLGKIDRKALRTLGTGLPPTARTTAVAPRTETERIIARVCREELGRPEFGIDDDFFEQGGDSLSAARVAGRLRREEGFDFETSTVLIARTVRAIAAVSRRGAVPGEPPLPVWTGELNADQQGMWLVDTLHAPSAAYTISAAVPLPDVSAEDLDRAWAEVCRRHPLLSSRWNQGQGRPTIVTTPAGIPPLRRTRVADLRAAQARQAQFARTPLALTDGAALVRAEVCHDGAGSRLLLAAHHLIVDGESFRVIRAGLSRALAGQDLGAPRLPVAPVAKNDPPEALAGQFRRAIPRVALSPGGDRGERASLATHRTTIAVAAEDIVARAATAHATTAYTVLLAAVAIVVSRHADAATFAVATPVTLRDDPRLRREVGYFARTAAVLCDIRDDDTVAGLVHRLERSVAEAIDHRDVPFDRLVDAVGAARVRGVIPLAQIMVTADVPIEESPGLVESLDRQMGPFDLAVEYHAEQQRIVVDSRTVAISPAEAEVLADHIASVLTILASCQAGRQVRDIELSSPADRARLKAWSTGIPIDSPVPLVDRIADAIARHADRPAIVCADGAVTFAELGRIAQTLRDRFARGAVAPGSRIAVVDNHPVLTVAAVIAGLFDGHTFVPVDPQAPAARVQRIRAMVQAAFVIDEKEPPAPAASRLAPPTPWPREVGAYMAFSSGSSELPKAVELPRAGLDDLASWATRRFDASAQSVVFQPASFGFDIWLLNTILSLTSGATLHARSPSRMGFGTDLAEDLTAARATHVTVSTSAWETVRPEWIPAGSLTVIVAGSRCTEELARRWSARVRLFNGYGPCETTVISSLKLCPPATIGEACPGESIQVLDERDQPCPVGVPGWIHLGGSGVGIGYAGAPRRTALGFRPDPFAGGPGERRYATGDRGYRLPTGEVQYIGRRDRQVKLRGYRLELDELEETIAKVPSVRAVSVAMRRPEVLACCVATAATAGHIRATLETVLPGYAIPSRILVVDQIPLTVNGKPDWPAIEDLAGKPAAGPAVPPQGVVAAAWRVVLGHDDFGATDNFFDVGGHSLLMPALKASLAEQGVQVDLVTLFRHATVAGLTTYLGDSAPILDAMPPRRVRRPRRRVSARSRRHD